MNSLFWDAEERATSLCKQQGGRLEVEGWFVEVQLRAARTFQRKDEASH